MQVTEYLEVDAKSFFDYLKESIMSDIEESRGKKAKASNVHKGYSYKRYLKDKHDDAHAVTVRITDWNPPHTYSTTITNKNGVTTMSYLVEEVERGGIYVTYTETFENGASASMNAVQKVVGAFKQVSGKNKIRNTLHDIESYIKAESYAEEDDLDTLTEV